MTAPVSGLTFFKDHNDSDKLRIELSESDHNDLADFGGSAPIPLGIWVHVATTYDASSGMIRLYFNGSEDASFSVAGANRLIDSSLTDVLIGAHSPSYRSHRKLCRTDR